MPEPPEVVQALLDAEAYPDSGSGVEMMQTRTSFVFLTGDYVYKVKKPVNLGYLDYTTLDRRHFYCQREVDLNRRLCPDTYLGVVPVTRNKGDIRVDGRGEVIEYAVKMRRLPEQAMMNVLLAKNSVSAAMVDGVARKLVEFHQRAETNAAISAFGGPDIIIRNTEENFDQTVKYIGNIISQERYRQVKG